MKVLFIILFSLLWIGCSGEEKATLSAGSDKAAAEEPVQGGDESVEVVEVDSIEPPRVDEAVDPILARLKNARPDFEFEAVEPTSVDGIYKTSIKRGPVIYITEDGGHFFAGDFFEVNPDGIVNIAERDMEKDRATDLAKVDDDDMIVFKAAAKKAHIYVFTDADCYYCQKLHNEMEAYNAKGIEVRYLAYPRAGIGSPSYKKIASAWCAEDPNDALTKIKAGQSIPENVCDGNPIKQQFNLGGKLGVTGTPALVTESGQLIAGYIPADKLVVRLGL